MTLPFLLIMTEGLGLLYLLFIETLSVRTRLIYIQTISTPHTQPDCKFMPLNVRFNSATLDRIMKTTVSLRMKVAFYLLFIAKSPQIRVNRQQLSTV